jgi:hypothetical protein
MANLVYKRFLKHNFLEKWDSLSQSAREDYLKKVDSALDSVGGVRIVIVVCDSAYALEKWNTLGIEIFPDKDDEKKYATILEKMALSQYIESEITIGTSHDLDIWFNTTLQE